MPVLVQDLLKGRSHPLVVSPRDPLGAAIDMMMANDYSQLPVIDETNTALGMVTTTSALEASRQLGCPPGDLRVVNAILRGVARVRPDDEIVDVLNRLKTDSAVLVVDANEHVTGILTSFDAMEFFRGWSEERMLVEDIETALKQCILLGFHDVSDPKLEEAIASVRSRRDVDVKLRRALAAFMKARGESSPAPEAEVRAALEAALAGETQPSFDDLDLADYIQLFFSKERWPIYAPVAGADPSILRALLDEVRKTRNRLAHFRGEITDEENTRLKYCAGWLAVALKLLRKEVHPSPSATVAQVIGVPSSQEAPLEEEGENSRYGPLAAWLQGLGAEVEDVTLEFTRVEELIGSELPPSARKHPAWWANDTVAHSQSRAWLNAGWRVVSVDLSEQVVRFGRIRERADAYRKFFAELSVRLAARDPSLRPPEPRGRSWMDIVRLPLGKKALGRVAFAFTRRRTARVELYIDSGDRARNKRIFEFLRADAQKLALECAEPQLAWERLEDAQACRIAAYRPLFITDEDQLPALLSWAEQAVPRFVSAFSDRLAAASDRV